MKEINLGKTLSELRAAKGVTQDDVAASLSVSNKTISKWENGDSSPDLSALTELAEYYAVSTDYLLGLRSESKSTDDFIAEQFKNLDRRDTALKLFEMLKATFPPCMEVAGTAFDDVCDNVDMIQRWLRLHDRRKSFESVLRQEIKMPPSGNSRRGILLK